MRSRSAGLGFGRRLLAPTMTLRRTARPGPLALALILAATATGASPSARADDAATPHDTAHDAAPSQDTEEAVDAGPIPFRKFVMVPDPNEDASAPAKPPPGPSFRARGARTRRTSTGSGALLIAVLVGGMGYYVIKRLRR